MPGSQNFRGALPLSIHQDFVLDPLGLQVCVFRAASQKKYVVVYLNSIFQLKMVGAIFPEICLTMTYPLN